MPPLISPSISRLLLRVEVKIRKVRCDKCKHYGPKVGQCSGSMVCSFLKFPTRAHKYCRHFEALPKKKDPALLKIWKEGHNQGRYNAFWDWSQCRIIDDDYIYMTPKHACLKMRLGLLSREKLNFLHGMDQGYDATMMEIRCDLSNGSTVHDIQLSFERYFRGEHIILRYKNDGLRLGPGEISGSHVNSVTLTSSRVPDGIWLGDES